jgi:hypothetical protein
MTATYPVRLRGRIDPDTSRWLWLLKWLLVIPHLVVLVFLWIAAFVLTIVAGFAILFTAHYPRWMFDFNVGVLRWTWRVSFYTINGFATDRYPPWTLGSVPDYPADLEIDHPATLSRGLVLVKWWLLAIPQYIVVGLFAGGWGNIGLIGVLAFIAAVILLFTGTYPTSLFEFVMGLNRWCYRVAGYVLLMTDTYPPFRIDLGGPDPGDVVEQPSVPKQPAAA